MPADLQPGGKRLPTDRALPPGSAQPLASASVAEVLLGGDNVTWNWKYRHGGRLCTRDVWPGRLTAPPGERPEPAKARWGDAALPRGGRGCGAPLSPRCATSEKLFGSSWVHAKWG